MCARKTTLHTVTPPPHSPRIKLRHCDKAGQVFRPPHPVANGREGLRRDVPLPDRGPFGIPGDIGNGMDRGGTDPEAEWVSVVG